MYQLLVYADDISILGGSVPTRMKHRIFSSCWSGDWTRSKCW